MIHRGESLVCAESGAVVASRLLRADRWWHRLRGLIGYAPLNREDALWIEPCSQVHTHFMRYPIRVVFLDADGGVLREPVLLRPWQVSPWVRGARSVVELHASSEGDVRIGQRLVAIRAGGAF